MKRLIKLDIAVDVLECMNLKKDLYTTNSDVVEVYNGITEISNQLKKPTKCDICPYKQIVRSLKLAWKERDKV